MFNLKSLPNLNLIILVFLFFLSIALLTTGGHLYGRDGVSLFFMTAGIVNNGSFSIPLNINTMGGKVGQDGLYYSPFGIGQPILAAPLFLIGNYFTKKTSFKYSAAFFVSLFNSFVWSLTNVFFFLLLLQLGFNPKHSFLSTIIYSFATIVFPYARYFYSEQFVTLCNIAAIFFINYSLIKKNTSNKWMILSGLCIAWAILCRPVSVLFVPVFFLYLVLLRKERREKIDSGEIWNFITPILISIIVVSFYNWYRFNSLFDLGYGLLPTGKPQGFDFPFLKGLIIFLFSPGKSIFLFSPVIILSLLMFKRFYQRAKVLTIFSILISLSYLFLYSQWCQIEGGYSWGPRFLVPIIPFLMLPFAEIFKQWKIKHLIFKAMIVVLISLSFAIQIIGISINFMEVIQAHPEKYYAANTGRYNLSFSPIPEHINLLIKYIKKVKKRLPSFRLSSTQRKQLFVINLSWDNTLDFWIFHFNSDGASKIMLSMIFITLLLISGISLKSILRILESQKNIASRIN